jgi:hypothetical protein
MRRMLKCFLLLTFFLSLFTRPAAANDCACPTVQAFGKGNTSCSASESAGRCSINYNLFSPATEARSVQLLNASGLLTVRTPPVGDSVQILTDLAKSEDLLVDAVFVYLIVGTADLVTDANVSVASGVRSIVQLLLPLRSELAKIFQPLQMAKWRLTPDAILKTVPIPKSIVFADNAVVLSEGCVEVQVSQLWAMFKASWSPNRQLPRCGN